MDDRLKHRLAVRVAPDVYKALTAMVTEDEIDFPINVAVLLIAQAAGRIDDDSEREDVINAVFTAIRENTKLAYAHMKRLDESANAADEVIDRLMKGKPNV